MNIKKQYKSVSKSNINILHLSNTDIRSDSRIIKEMNSVAKGSKLYNLIGIGVSEKKKNSFNKSNLNINSINIFFRDVNYIPKVITHFFLILEITIKMLSLSLKSKPKIVHCHDTPVLPLGILIKFFTGSKVIYDTHELASDRNGLSSFLGWLVLFVEKRLWRFIDRLIVVSPSIKNWYMKNIGDKKCSIILNSPKVNNKNNNIIDKTYFRRKFSIPKNTRIFLNIGIVGPGRGIDLLTESFINQRAHLIFLGYGEYKEKLLKTALKNSNIHFHDSVPHDEVVKIAKSADVGLCLIENCSKSDFLCLPNKLFEYAFSEIPVLASNFPDLSYIVKGFKLGKCCNLKKNNIQKSIKEFVEMKRLPKINSKNLYELSWDAQEVKLIGIYSDLIEVKKFKK